MVDFLRAGAFPIWIDVSTIVGTAVGDFAGTYAIKTAGNGTVVVLHALAGIEKRSDGPKSTLKFHDGDIET